MNCDLIINLRPGSLAIVLNIQPHFVRILKVNIFLACHLEFFSPAKCKRISRAQLGGLHLFLRPISARINLLNDQI